MVNKNPKTKLYDCFPGNAFYEFPLTGLQFNSRTNCEKNVAAIQFIVG